MKTIRVVAAIIKHDNRILATQRGYGEFQGGWEFPGGKIEEGETPQLALVREIKEELDADITIDELFEVVEYNYPNFHLTMYCYLCRLKSMDFVLKEHEAAKWLEKHQLNTVDWLPADLDLIQRLSLLL